jgi:ribonuclease HII
VSISFLYENEARTAGFRFVIGVDEAGRGPLAGPVVACAVLLKNKKFLNRIDDSKKITPRQREAAFHEIHQNAYVGVGVVSEAVIDTINIVEATYHAMSMAVSRIIETFPSSQITRNNFHKKVLLLVDGNSFKTPLPYSYKTVVDGDSLSMSIACASIVAKVTRDRILDAYDQIFPQYGFKQHKGYGTEEHRDALRKFGPSLIHRKTYSWV